ncbi:MAG: hypothetical protein ACRCU2_16845, partial [Planktothrix sp.]
MALFYHKKNDYLFNDNYAVDLDSLTSYKTIYCPLDCDTEFYSKLLFDIGHERTIITNQIKAIDEKEGKIYAHPHIRKIARHKVFEGFSPIQYLQDMGVDITIERVKNFKNIKKLPVLQFCLYGFFLNAEVAAIVTDGYRDDIVKKILSGKIDQNRRLKAVNKQKWGELDFIDMPWVVTINGNLRRIRIAYYDTCAIHGPANYAGLCKATGIELIYKDTLSQKDKEDMLT